MFYDRIGLCLHGEFQAPQNPRGTIRSESLRNPPLFGKFLQSFPSFISLSQKGDPHPFAMVSWPLWSPAPGHRQGYRAGPRRHRGGPVPPLRGLPVLSTRPLSSVWCIFVFMNLFIILDFPNYFFVVCEEALLRRKKLSRPSECCISLFSRHPHGRKMSTRPPLQCEVCFHYYIYELIHYFGFSPYIFCCPVQRTQSFVTRN